MQSHAHDFGDVQPDAVRNRWEVNALEAAGMAVILLGILELGLRWVESAFLHAAVESGLRAALWVVAGLAIRIGATFAAERMPDR